MFFSRDNDTDSEYLGPPDGTLVCVCMANYDASNRDHHDSAIALNTSNASSLPLVNAVCVTGYESFKWAIFGLVRDAVYSVDLGPI